MPNPLESRAVDAQLWSRGGFKVRIHDFEPNFWHLLAAEPGIEASFKRWNLIVITVLVFLVLGVFVAGLGSEVLTSPTASSAPSQVTQHPVHHG